MRQSSTTFTTALLLFVLCNLTAGCVPIRQFFSLKEKNHPRQKCVDTLLEKQITLYPGDVLLCRGNGIVSHTILTLTTEENNYTHAALYTGDVVTVQKETLDVPCIIDIVGNKKHNCVRKISLSQFISESHEDSVAVFRLHCASSEEAQLKGKRIAAKASEYYFRSIKFDYSFDITEDARLYCTELVWKAFWEGAGIDLNTRPVIYKGREIIGFKPFLDTDMFGAVFIE